MGKDQVFSVNSCESLQSFQIKMNKILKGGKPVAFLLCLYNGYGLDFVLNSSLRNINGDIFGTANKILLSYSVVMNIAGNFKKCSLLNTYAQIGALNTTSLKHSDE